MMAHILIKFWQQSYSCLLLQTPSPAMVPQNSHVVVIDLKICLFFYLIIPLHIDDVEKNCLFNAHSQLSNTNFSVSLESSASI